MYGYIPANRKLHQGNLMKVSGEGEVAILPDTASVNLGIITENKELITAQEQNSHEVSKAIQSLLSLGIPKEHLQTFDYRIESEYDFVQGKQIFRGYKVTHILQVKMEDLSMVGKVVDTAVKNGVNYVANVQFTSKNKHSFYQHALSAALNNAIQKAKTIAKTLNVTLNPTPVQVIEGGSTLQPLYPSPGTFVKGITSTQFEPGQILVKAVVSAEFHYH